MFSLSKKIILLIIFTVTLADVSQAQPRAIVAEPVKDLGSFYQDQLIVYDFIVKNEGNATLQITDVKPACGCTIAYYDKTIEPGKTGKVHAKVDISAFNGLISKDIMVLTSDVANPQINLCIEAIVKAGIFPADIADFAKY